MSLVYYGRGTLGKIKKSVNTVSIGYMPDNSGRKPAFLNVRIIISDQFSYRYHIIAFYGDLNCPDYYLSLNLGNNNVKIETLFLNHFKRRHIKFINQYHKFQLFSYRYQTHKQPYCLL